MENIRIRILDVGDGLRENTSLLNCCYDFFDYNDATPLSVSSVPLRTMTGIAVADSGLICDNTLILKNFHDIIGKRFDALICLISPISKKQISSLIKTITRVQRLLDFMNIIFRDLISDMVPKTIPLKNPQNHEKNYRSAGPAIGSSFP